jgi:hypothetical protein
MMDQVAKERKGFASRAASVRTSRFVMGPIYPVDYDLGYLFTLTACQPTFSFISYGPVEHDVNSGGRRFGLHPDQLSR